MGKERIFAMSTMKLREGVWSVGVLNPSMRVFDVVMKAPYGTSYNAYLLTGEKNVLIDTVHLDYWEEFEENIRQVLPLEKLDYLIMDHTEPDHSGSVARLLDRCPNLQILCSNSAKKFLASIANREVPCTVVKDGDTLSLGDKTLHFISAPLLHWPDTMFTWDPADSILFTCDFLGAHFCEPSLWDTGIHTKHREAYEGQLKNYYDCIFSPFKPSVLSGLSKIPPETKLVCPSHGPILSELLPHVMELFQEWSTPVSGVGKTAGILYTTAYGCTEALAKAAADALDAEGFQVTMIDLTYAPIESSYELVNTADVLLFGSPTINRAAPPAIWGAIHAVDAINTRGRSAAAFGSYGWSGEAPDMLLTHLSKLKFKTPETPFRVCFVPTEDDLSAMADYARQTTALAKVSASANA